MASIVGVLAPHVPVRWRAGWSFSSSLERSVDASRRPNRCGARQWASRETGLRLAPADRRCRRLPCRHDRASWRRSGLRDRARARTHGAANPFGQAASDVDRASQPPHRDSAAAARRSLHTLSKLGFVAADDARRFYLRPRVLSFSHGYLSASPLAILAQPILDRLGESLREACSLAMLDGDEICTSRARRRRASCPRR